MKYTLFTALALAAAIAYGDEETDTYTTTTSETSTNFGNYSAWTVVWGSSNGLSTTLNGETAIIPDTVSLSSIRVTSPDASSGTYTSDVKLAVYTYTSTGSGSSSTDVLGSLVGLSTNSTGSWTANTNYTFEFSDVTLESGTRYAFVFVSADSTAESLASALESGTYSGTAFRVVVSSGLQSGGDFTRLYGTGLSGSTYWSGYAVDATYVTTAAVPEPATATLGLLALGALALRRRRA